MAQNKIAAKDKVISEETKKFLRRQLLRVRFYHVTPDALYDFDIGKYVETGNPFKYVRSEAYRPDDDDAPKALEKLKFDGAPAMILQYSWMSSFNHPETGKPMKPNIEELDMALKRIIEALWDDTNKQYMKVKLLSATETTDQILGEWTVVATFNGDFTKNNLAQAYAAAAHLEIMLVLLFDVMPWVILKEAGDDRFTWLPPADAKPEAAAEST